MVGEVAASSPSRAGRLVGTSDARRDALYVKVDLGATAVEAQGVVGVRVLSHARKTHGQLLVSAAADAASVASVVWPTRVLVGDRSFAVV